MKPEFFYSILVFVVKMSIRLGICLNGLLGIHFNLKRLVVFIDIHFMILVPFMLHHIMLRFGVTCVILLRIMLVHVLIMHVILSLVYLYL